LPPRRRSPPDVHRLPSSFTFPLGRVEFTFMGQQGAEDGRMSLAFHGARVDPLRGPGILVSAHLFGDPAPQARVFFQRPGGGPEADLERAVVLGDQAIDREAVPDPATELEHAVLVVLP